MGKTFTTEELIVNRVVTAQNGKWLSFKQMQQQNQNGQDLGLHADE